MEQQKEYEYTSLAQASESKYGRLRQFWRKKRYIVALLGLFGYFSGYALRSILVVAIVDMTQLKNVTLTNGTTILKREYNWDTRLQGYVLSSFYYGYIFTQILGGYLATKFGGARIFGIGIASTGLFTIITPWVVHTNVYFLIAVRVLEGLFEGVTYPSFLQIWTNWAPPLEKTRLATIALSGTYIGNIVAMPVSALLATHCGWETIFYVFGGFSLIWYLIWSIVVTDSPEKDSGISLSELKYITESIKVTKCDDQIVVPWKSLLTSKAVWAISVTLYCDYWGWYTITTFLPQMMNSLLGFDLNKSGFLAALPFVGLTISNLIAGQLADWLVIRKYLTTTHVRRLLICTGFLGKGTFLLVAVFWLSPVATPVFLVMAATFGALSYSSIMVNTLDVARNFAGVIYGLSNTIGTIPGILSPILTGYIVRDPTDVHQWRIIFYITAFFYIFGCIVCILFISGQIQPWAEQQKQGKEDVTAIETVIQDFEKERC